MSTLPNRQHSCDAWIRLFTDLHRNGVPTLEQLEAITDPQVRFLDPFNELQGRSAIRALLAHTQQQVKQPRFVVLDRAQSEDRVYLKWEMTGTIKLLGRWRVTGMSELAFAADGRLLLHQDYWDAADQFYARLPLIGWLLRRVRSAVTINA
jgi:steroid delta-isomerase